MPVNVPVERGCSNENVMQITCQLPVPLTTTYRHDLRFMKGFFRYAFLPPMGQAMGKKCAGEGFGHSGRNS
jgi:hypothetical protein